MPLYVLLTKLTEQGRKTVKDRPERIREVNKEVAAMGGKLIAQYATLGRYDFVSVVEADNNQSIARISVELGARGTLRITTMPAMDVTTFISRVWAPRPSNRRPKLD